MPRKTTKKPTTRKAAAKKTAPKRKAYQTGGAAKPQMPRSQALAREQERAQEEARLRAEEARARAEAEERERQNAVPPNPMESQYADRINATMQRYRREQGLMELGNRQRAAAARARAQRPAQGPSRAQAARNRAEYERAMRARQANLSRGSTPSPRPTPRPAPPSPLMSRDAYQQELQNRRIGIPARPPATSINRGNGIASPAIRPPNYRPPVRPNTGPAPTFDMNQARPVGQVLTPQQLEQLRTNPNRPNMVNQVQNIRQAKAAERQRIQQQIAQLQARLRQLGG